MVGAVACLSAYEGIGIVIHGSSGCWFYPSSLLRVEIGCTDIHPADAIFGARDRVRARVEAAVARHPSVAVVNTCVPGIVGEDLDDTLADLPVTVVDAPGFLGGATAGHARAIEALEPVVDESSGEVGIDGLSPLDPFARGNLHECERLLRLAGAEPGPRFAGGPVAALRRSAPRTVIANPSFAAGPGERVGDLLGLDAVRTTFALLANGDDRLAFDRVEAECDRAEERIVRACDKYLRRCDPPLTAFFGDGAYCAAAARFLERYLDGECAVIGYRGAPPDEDAHTVVRADTLSRVQVALDSASPDLILGSSFEHRLRPNTAFVPLAPPLRDRPRLAAVPIIGVEGALALMEAVLGACGSQRKA
jgi:hypothetical protein